MLAPGTAPSPDPCQAKPNQLGVVIASRPRKRARKLKENFQQSPGTAPGPSGRCGGFNLASCTASPKSITYISDELGSKPDHGAAALRGESVPGVRMWADRSRRRCGPAEQSKVSPVCGRSTLYVACCILYVACCRSHFVCRVRCAPMHRFSGLRSLWITPTLCIDSTARRTCAPSAWYGRRHAMQANQGTGNRDKGTGNRDNGTGNRDKGTGIRDKGMGNRDKNADSTHPKP